MAQNNRNKPKKRARTYSTDSMIVCMVVGLLLIALGVLIFLSTVAGMTGDLFLTLRQVSCGMTGVMSVVLPVLPVWGGILVMLTTQRKAPVRPFVLFWLILTLACAFVPLITMVGSQPLMTYMQEINRGMGVGEDMSAFLARAYDLGANYRVGGGILGMLAAYPLWRLLGTVGGAVVAALGMIVAFLFLIRLDVKGISSKLKTRQETRRTRNEQEQLQLRRQELAWQQEQMRRQQEQARLQQEQRAYQEHMRQEQYRQEKLRQEQLRRQQEQYRQEQAAIQQQLQSGPVVQRVQTGKQRTQQPPQVGFPPTPEERGVYPSRRQEGDAAVSEVPLHKKLAGLFRRDKNEEYDGYDETGMGGEPYAPPAYDRPAPARKAPQSRPAASRAAAQQVQWADVPGDGYGEEALPAYTGEEPPVKQQPVRPAPAAKPARTRPAAAKPQAPDMEQPLYAYPVQEEPVLEQPVQEEPVLDVPAREKSVREETAPEEKSVRPGSFLSRLKAAQGGEAAAAENPQPRKSRKDVPSGWSGAEEKGGAASWRSQEEWDGSDMTARPAARSTERAAAAKPETPARPAKQKPKSSWAETPPWEDVPEEQADVPEQPLMPVVTSKPPEGGWEADLKVPLKRTSAAEQMNAALFSEPQEVPYVYPSMDLLNHPEPQAGFSEEEDAMRSRRLENTLQSFRVPAKVRHITHGPAISRFELELAAGIKVSKVTDLNRNIAMNMEVKSVRIEAPIPGKSLVGVEVPNRQRATVTLREVLESDVMAGNNKPLVVALGKDIAGTPIVCDLSKMPHLLIAGATGSGKSVCINTIINSLLYRCSPKEVRLIMIDPKVVELQCYNGIPHLLIPVVSDPQKASGALAWAVGEMMDRYHRFQEVGCRNIDGYNGSVGEDEKMPRIVIIIDELADLMMTCKKDVEERINRLAQLARAAGIHLIVATQRPSVDVITGLIKANIPSRIAFKVSSNVDSRTILDRIGAEQLLGYGDMLYMPTGEFTPIRVQGCFLSDGEVNRITDFIRETCPADYDPKVLEELDRLQSESDAPAMPELPTGNGEEMSDESLLLQCIEMAVNDGQLSTSLVQRRLKLGYARAGRLVDKMEELGVITAKDGAKPRMCLISREQFEAMKLSGELG